MSAIEQLKGALQALAQPSHVQVELFPDYVCVPDELVLEFDRVFQMACREGGFTPHQYVALTDLDAAIEKESGPTHAELWTEAALHTDQRWERFRELARSVLVAFGWAVMIPPNDRAVYIHKNDA